MTQAAMTLDEIREASAEELIPALAGLECKTCNGKGDVYTEEAPYPCTDCGGNDTGLGSSWRPGTGLALPGLSRECPKNYDGLCILCHFSGLACSADCPCRGSGRVPLQGAEAERALREAMNQDGEWIYGYIPEGTKGFIHDMVHEVIWRQGPTYGPNYLTVLARAVSLAYLRQSAS